MSLEGMMKSMGITGLSPQELKQAESFWKILDEMASSNPEEYRNFIDKNLKEGSEALKKEKEKELQDLRIKPKEGYLLLLYANLKTLKTKEELTQIQEKLNFLNKEQKFQQKSDEKVYSKVKIYLNVCTHEQVLQPIDEHGNVVADLTNEKTWHRVPYSISDSAFHFSQSGQPTYYFLVVINDKLYDFLMKNSNSLVNYNLYLIDSFQNRLKTDKNPLFKPNSDSYQYYEIDKSTLKAHSKKRFKFKGNKFPQECLLELEADSKFYQKTKQKAINKQNISIEETLKGLKLDAAGGMQLPDAFQGKDPLAQKKTEAPKKILIEEVSSTSNLEDPSFFNTTITTEGGSLVLDVFCQDVDLLVGSDLDMSSDTAKLTLSDGSIKTIKLPKAVNNDEVSASLKKKKKILSIKAPLI